MIIHILGKPGTGKTTLGKRLSKLPNTVVIDTDDIDDSNAFEILSNSKYEYFFKNENTIGGFWKMLEQHNLDKLFEILEQNKNKHVIIVGLTIFPPQETAVIGYSIDIDSTTNYFQINKRTLNDICTNCKDLTELFEKEKNKLKLDLEILFKYKIRNEFPLIPFRIDEAIEMRKKHSEEIGYKYMKVDDIYNDISKIISKNNSLKKSKLLRNKPKKL